MVTARKAFFFKYNVRYYKPECTEFLDSYLCEQYNIFAYCANFTFVSEFARKVFYKCNKTATYFLHFNNSGRFFPIHTGYRYKYGKFYYEREVRPRGFFRKWINWRKNELGKKFDEHVLFSYFNTNDIKKIKIKKRVEMWNSYTDSFISEKVIFAAIAERCLDSFKVLSNSWWDGSTGLLHVGLEEFVKYKIYEPFNLAAAEYTLLKIHSVLDIIYYFVPLSEKSFESNYEQILSFSKNFRKCIVFVFCETNYEISLKELQALQCKFFVLAMTCGYQKIGFIAELICKKSIFLYNLDLYDFEFSRFFISEFFYLVSLIKNDSNNLRASYLLSEKIINNNFCNEFIVMPVDNFFESFLFVYDILRYGARLDNLGNFFWFVYVFLKIFCIGNGNSILADFNFRLSFIDSIYCFFFNLHLGFKYLIKSNLNNISVVLLISLHTKKSKYLYNFLRSVFSLGVCEIFFCFYDIQIAVLEYGLIMFCLLNWLNFVFESGFTGLIKFYDAQMNLLDINSWLLELRRPNFLKSKIFNDDVWFFRNLLDKTFSERCYSLFFFGILQGGAKLRYRRMELFGWVLLKSNSNFEFSGTLILIGKKLFRAVYCLLSTRNRFGLCKFAVNGFYAPIKMLLVGAFKTGILSFTSFSPLSYFVSNFFYLKEILCLVSFFRSSKKSRRNWKHGPPSSRRYHLVFDQFSYFVRYRLSNDLYYNSVGNVFPLIVFFPRRCFIDINSRFLIYDSSRKTLLGVGMFKVD